MALRYAKQTSVPEISICGQSQEGFTAWVLWEADWEVLLLDGVDFRSPKWGTSFLKLGLQADRWSLGEVAGLYLNKHLQTEVSSKRRLPRTQRRGTLYSNVLVLFNKFGGYSFVMANLEISVPTTFGADTSSPDQPVVKPFVLSWTDSRFS